MRSKINNPSNQLRWVILLLAIAVILPTVCLLWFMTQAVKNEQLAIRQKLIDSYTSRAQEIFFRNREDFINDQNNFSALVIYDQNDKLIYPVRTNQAVKSPAYNIEKAWKLEYVDKNYDEAIKQYDSISIYSSIIEITYDCKIAVVRCLIKQNKIIEAIEKCHQLVYPAPNALPVPPIYAAYARLMLADLYSNVNHTDMFKELQNQLSNSIDSVFATETKIFVLGELIKLAEKSGLTDKLNTEIQNARKTIDSGLVSVMAADYLEDHSGLKLWPENTFRKIQTSPPLYGIYFKTTDRQILGLLTPEKMTGFWQKSVDDFTDKLVFCRIYDDTGQQIAGEPRLILRVEGVLGVVFSTLNLKNYFADWKVELYLRWGVFKEAADRKKLIYIWIAAIVIGLMLVSFFGASKAVLKQAKLNKLKNDFIATVTHELKTPLSSMRVLVDTLLEGRCENQQQATDYLKLISKENIRLSRLIDNFLTFSRMERNKQAFEIVKTSPAAIANDAIETFKTRFDDGKCEFEVNIDENLPDVWADHDAMVTVLLNLLDNAYKYSYDEKRIVLKVSAGDKQVCFQVVDNGLGLSRRYAKKIFNRFYQVDRSLSRRAGGCGLGLSIVKFIIDAHKGSISVNSKPGKGSLFTVKLGKINSGEL